MDSFVLSSWMLWFLLGAGLCVAEIFVPGFVIAFFGMGAFVTSLAVGLFPDLSMSAKLAIFLISSILVLIPGRRYLVKPNKKDVENPDDDDFADAWATVIESLEAPAFTGRVQWEGSTWAAHAETAIPAGTRVRIKSRSNLQLEVFVP